MKNILKFHQVKTGQVFTVIKEQGRDRVARGRWVKQGDSHSTQYHGNVDIILRGDDIVALVKNNVH